MKHLEELVASVFLKFWLFFFHCWMQFTVDHSFEVNVGDQYNHLEMQLKIKILYHGPKWRGIINKMSLIVIN